MALARVAAVLAVAAGVALPASAGAEETCLRGESYYPYVCHDPDYPGCVAYGSLGEEGMFHVGQGCPWPWGGS